MTVDDSTTATVAPRAERAAASRRPNSLYALYLAIIALMLISFVRAVTGANDITSGGTVGATISLAIPIALAGLGGLWSERSGVVNIGLEGMMILGTFFGADFAYFSHSPWVGVLGGIAGGLIGGVLHAVATVTFGVDQIVSGVAITILATGLARYLAGVFFTGQPGGGPTQSPSIPRFQKLRVPGADSFFGKLERHHWFVVSDVAGVLRGLTTSLTPFTILMILMFPLSWFVLWRTSFGLRLRSCGESPSAAESLGVPVYRMKYIAVSVSGVLAGLGGAFLADFSGIYREGQTGGRGFIGLAAMIFGNWRPGGLVGGAALFGYTDAVQLRGGGSTVHAMLLLLAVLTIGVGIWQVRKHRVLQGVVAIAAGALVAGLYFVSDTVPDEFTGMTPYVATLLVLALSSQRLRMPAADGLPYRKGEAG